MSFVDFDHGVRSIGERTDPAGAPVSDLSAREDGLIHHVLSGGVVKPAEAFRVVADGTMTLKVGSGHPYRDLAVVESTEDQQPPYLVRLNDVTVDVQLDASGSQARTDQVFLVVQDDTWDGSGRALARIGYRKGAAGAGSPGPDPAWHAWLLLASVTVAGGSSGVPAGNVSDGRVTSKLPVALVPELAASLIASGTLDLDRIPNLPASRTTSGTFDDGRIPNMNTSKLTSGQLPVQRGGTGRSSVTSGRFLSGAGTGAMVERTPDQVRGDIGALPTTHDTNDRHVNAGGFTAATPPDGFPVGVTVFQASGGSSGAPSGQASSVMTFRPPESSSAVQIAIVRVTSTAVTYIRNAGTSASSWQSWSQVQFV